MFEPTYRQHQILRYIAKNGITNINDKDNPNIELYWELVRAKYLKNFIGRGIYDWRFDITEKGEKYLESVIEKVKAEPFPIVDFNKLSEFGLIVEINRKVLHPLGLALCYKPDTGMSDGAYVSDDYVWEYDKATLKEDRVKYKAFIKNRIEILKELLKDEE